MAAETVDVSGRLSTGGITHQLLFGFEQDWERGRFTQSNLTNVTPINVLAPSYAFNGADPVADTPTEFAAFCRSEYEKFGAIVRAANITMN